MLCPSRNCRNRSNESYHYLSKARKENKNTYPLALYIESTLEKPKGKIKNGQSSDTGNIGIKTRTEDKES